MTEEQVERVALNPQGWTSAWWRRRGPRVARWGAGASASAWAAAAELALGSGLALEPGLEPALALVLAL